MTSVVRRTRTATAWSGSVVGSSTSTGSPTGCDTPACREPSHLVAMTHRENMADAARKGRLGRGRVA